MDQQPVPVGAPGGLVGRRPGDWPVEQAQVELTRRWLAAFGPAMVADLRRWTG